MQIYSVFDDIIYILVRIFLTIRLHTLDLSYNKLSSFPKIGEFQSENMRNLNLEGNLLDSFSMENYVHWHLLEKLNLSKNHIRIVPPEIGFFNKLRSLDLSDNRELTELPNQVQTYRPLDLFSLSTRIAL